MVSKIVSCSSEKLGNMLQFDISVYVFRWVETQPPRTSSTCPTYFPSQKMLLPRVTQRIPPSYANPWRWNAKHGRPTWEMADVVRVAAFGWQLLLMVQKSGGNAPVDMVSISFFTTGFIHPRWLFGISEPSTVGCHIGFS